MTPAGVGFVLVEGRRGDGAVIDHDAFDLQQDGGPTAARAAEQVADAVTRTKAIEHRGVHRLHSIGVTWSGEATTEASLLLESLTQSGFDNVVPVRLPEASEALARGIGHAVGYDNTAVCVIERDTAIVLVDTDYGVMQTSANDLVDSEDMIRWLNATFAREGAHPEALCVVGSFSDRDALISRLEAALSLPVFAPADTELALARGAALASAANGVFTHAEVTEDPIYDTAADGHRWPLSHMGLLFTLVAGVLTFVVSLSLAVSLQLAPGRNSGQAEARQVSNTSPAPPAVVKPVPPPPAAVQLPAADPPQAPAPQIESPALPAPEPQMGVPDEAAAGPSAAPAASPAAPPGPSAPPAVAPALPPPIVPAPVAQVPQQRPGILDRIRERLGGLRRQDQAPEQPLPPPPIPGPDGAVPPP
jgi:hypothetical protein